MDQDDVKRMYVNMLVDSGAYMMAINETIQAQLEFAHIEKRKVQVADGRVVEYDGGGPVNGKEQTAKLSGVMHLCYPVIASLY